MEVRGVWRLRDFGPCLVWSGRRYLCAGLGLGAGGGTGFFVNFSYLIRGLVLKIGKTSKTALGPLNPLP